MNTFLGYINPLPFSKRDKAIYSHLRNSTTLSSHQLLALDFEGTPKELHITAKNNKTVSIKTIFSNRSKRWSYFVGQVGGVFKVESRFNNYAAIA
ncbi:MAG: hypothetical protein CO093_02255 [Alphaproteobacteria bacterium CG_4_9_14_3_um_filter_47_13]|nr:MAG: hypothetical protein CO093_02255 [Alphaproteobacteria bacterium CG_4_9_14_3_um_filter_47_13]